MLALLMKENSMYVERRSRQEGRKEKVGRPLLSLLSPLINIICLSFMQPLSMVGEFSHAFYAALSLSLMALSLLLSYLSCSLISLWQRQKKAASVSL